MDEEYLTKLTTRCALSKVQHPRVFPCVVCTVGGVICNVFQGPAWNSVVEAGDTFVSALLGERQIDRPEETRIQ